MKYILLIVALLAAPGFARGQTPLQDMVKTEQAFSKMAEDQNARDAFVAFIADDGLLFRPDAVNGKKWMQEHPVPPSDKNPLLAWQPAFAGISASGDMGFTTGPWESKADRSDAQPSGYGDFVTVWKKQADGTWKFVVDLGISHPQSGGPQTLWQPDEPKAKTFKAVDEAVAREALLERDRNYASAQRKQGLAAVYPVYAGRDVRLYRPGSLPFVGVQAATDALATTSKGRIKWKPDSGDVSRAGDLGYTYGTFEVTDDAKNVIEKGSYVRIWKKRNGMWRIVMDVANPHEGK